MGDAWMNEHAVLAEWHWKDKTEVLGEKPTPAPFCLPQIALT